MEKLQDKQVLGINVNLLNKEQVLNILKNKLSSNNKEIFCVSTLNIELIMRANKNYEFKHYLNDISNLNTIDGVGILNVFRWYGLNSYERICGSDLAYDLAQICQELGKKYFILGSSEDSSEKAKEKLKELYNGLDIENYSPPYTKNIDFSAEETSKIKQIIQDAKPDVLCVAFGALKQELWIKNNLDFLKENNVKIAIGLGGSFDFIAGKVERAPEFFKKTGNEWLYRLIKEPKTRFKRQISTIPLYYLLCFWEFIKQKGLK